MNFKRLLHTDLGQIFISLFLGLGIATLFRKVCNDKDCLDFKGPVLQDFKDNKYKFNGKCYKYSTTSVSCDENKNTIKVN
jgi:hypothetical protein